MTAIRKFLNIHRKRKETQKKSPKLEVTMKDFRQAIKKIKEQKKSRE